MQIRCANNNPNSPCRSQTQLPIWTVLPCGSSGQRMMVAALSTPRSCHGLLYSGPPRAGECGVQTSGIARASRCEVIYLKCPAILSNHSSAAEAISKEVSSASTAVGSRSQGRTGAATLIGTSLAGGNLISHPLDNVP